MLYDERKASVEECFFGRAASAFSGKKIRCKGINPEESELGYTSEMSTDGWREIYIARCHEMMKDMDDDHAALFRCGICVHETLHQIYTDFESFRTRLSKYSGNRGNLFATVFNIVEDSRIEGFAYLSFGGEMLSSLKYTIRTIWENSENINETDPDYVQVLSALIQMGDCGEFKGTLSETANKCLEKIRPLFARGICSHSGFECSEISAKITDIILKICPAGTKFRKVKNHGEGTGKNVPDTYASTKSKTAEKISKGSVISEKKGLTADEVGSKDIEAACKKLKERLDDEKKKIRNADERPEKDGKKKNIADSELYNGYTHDKYCESINNIKAEHGSGDREEYLKVCDEYPAEINMLEKTMSKAMVTEPARKLRSGKGKIDLFRYNRYIEKSYTGSRIFNAEKNAERHDVCIMLVVDCSGSMASYQRYRHAKNAAVIIAESCRLCGIPLYVLGYTADKKSIGTVDHIHYLTWNGSSADRYSVVGINPQRENRDGPTIRYATHLIKTRNEKNKLMIVISDGSPQACNYIREEASEDTRRAVREARKSCSVLGVCINSDEEGKLKQIYDGNYLSVKDLSELPVKLCRKLQTIASKW